MTAKFRIWDLRSQIWRPTEGEEIFQAQNLKFSEKSILRLGVPSLSSEWGCSLAGSTLSAVAKSRIWDFRSQTLLRIGARQLCLAGFSMQTYTHSEYRILLHAANCICVQGYLKWICCNACCSSRSCVSGPLLNIEAIHGAVAFEQSEKDLSRICYSFKCLVDLFIQ